MEIVVAIIVVGVLAIFVGVGYGIGKGGNPPTISIPPDTTSVENCKQACATWDNARQMLCSAKADEAAARSRADAIRTQMLAYIAAAVSLTIAGAATLVAAGVATATIFGIPLAVILYGIAGGLFVAAAAAHAAAAVFAGQLIAAESDASAKAAVRSAWEAEVARARSEVNAKCSLAEANACLSRTAPC